MGSYEERILQALESNEDVYGREVLEGGEASFDRVKDYLVALRLADWAHRYYPLTLSDLCSTGKARALYEGSEIHLDIRRPEGTFTWMPETYTAQVLVGESAERFGSDESRLIGPKLLAGYLPMYEWWYRQDGVTYHQTIFAMEEREAGLVVYWKLESDAPGHAALQLKGADEFRLKGTRLVRATGECLGQFGPGAEFDAASKRIRFAAAPGKPAFAMLHNRPSRWDSFLELDAGWIDRAAKRCRYRWDSFLASGAQVSVPEERINNAWKAMLCGIATICTGDAMHYSVNNFYQKLYSSETPNTIETLAEFGHMEWARRCWESEFLYRSKPGTELAAAGWRLRDMCRHYFLSGDRDFVESNLAGLRAYAELFIDSRKSANNHGLLPKAAFAWDHPEIKMNNAVTNAVCWRGLRDLSLVLEELGHHEAAKRYAEEAADFRKAILDAVERSVVPDSDQVFIPLGLLGDEEPINPLGTSMKASYYNIVISALLWSGIFPGDSPRPAQIAEYQEHRRGIMLGLLRMGRAPGEESYCNRMGINDVYGFPRHLYLLSIGQVDKFLLAFYSKLAHTFARDTFVGCEGTSVFPVPGETWRRMGMPPNSYANANFLQMLRHMLVMEKDPDDDGREEELWLTPGTPRAWLDPGKEIRFERMPTSFGLVDCRLSAWKDGKSLRGEIHLAARRVPRAVILTLRLPAGTRIESVEVNGRRLSGFDAEKGQVMLPGDARDWSLAVKLNGLSTRH